MTPKTERDDRLRDDLASLRIERDAAADPRAPAPAARSGRCGSRSWPGWRLLAGAGAWRLVRGSAVPVTVARATAVDAGTIEPAPVLSGSGYVVTGERYVSIGVRVAGRIDRYFIEEGQTVKKGDPLVQLDDRDYRAAVGRVEASLALARANRDLADAELRRGRALKRAGVISDQELDVLENKAAVAHAGIAQLEAELDAAQVNLDYTTLRAPTDGVVLAKLKEVGEIAVPGGFAGSGDLVRIANLSDMRAEVDVNEADLERVKMGGQALVTPGRVPRAALSGAGGEALSAGGPAEGHAEGRGEDRQPRPEAAARHEHAGHLPRRAAAARRAGRSRRCWCPPARCSGTTTVPTCGSSSRIGYGAATCRRPANRAIAFAWCRA